MPAKISAKIVYDLIQEVKPDPKETPFSPEMELWNSGLLDSFSIVQFVSLLEERFDLVFDFTDLRGGNFRSPATIANLLTSKYGLLP